MTFPVPATTGSVTLLQQGTEQLAARSVTWNGVVLDNTVVPLTVSVDGTKYFDDAIVPPDDPADWGSPDGIGIGAIYSYIPSPWTGAMTVPNTTNALNYVGDERRRALRDLVGGGQRLRRGVQGPRCSRLRGGRRDEHLPARHVRREGAAQARAGGLRRDDWT